MPASRWWHSLIFKAPDGPTMDRGLLVWTGPMDWSVRPSEYLVDGPWTSPYEWTVSLDY